MTSSSSPGLSLKMEGISYIAAAEPLCNCERDALRPGLGESTPAKETTSKQ